MHIHIIHDLTTIKLSKLNVYTISTQSSLIPTNLSFYYPIYILIYDPTITYQIIINE
jgi:hypothetical protein